MARTWRDYDARDATPDTCDKSDNSDKSARDAPIVPNVTIVTGLPGDIQRGLERLSKLPAPRVHSPEIWPRVVADALGLAADGWAGQALALGWSALDLFGAVPRRDGDPDGDGLAVRLDGRKVLAICASFATVASGPAGRSYLYRGETEGARVLWALGGRG